MRSARRARTPLLVAAVAWSLVACSGYRSYRSAQQAEQRGDWDAAVLHYMELLQQDPGELRYRSALLRAKIQASHEHFARAKQFRDANLLRQAMLELQKAVQLDPTNQYAQSELGKVRVLLEAEKNGGVTASIEEMKQRSRGAQAQPPVLNPRSNEPIDLDFPEPVSVQRIYQALGKAFGINVLFDPKLRDQTVAITLRQVNAQAALEIVMRTAGHFYKVLDEHSIIVVADTPQNRRDYEDLIIQTFFLSNSEVKDVMQMLRSLVDARKIASNEQLNAIILRDTADKVKVAERIITANDKAKAEVVIDVELLQLDSSALQNLGVSLVGGSGDQYNLGFSIDTGGEDVPLRFSDLEFLNENNWTLTIPNFLLDFAKTAADAETLAKPQVRISEGERARLKIGDRVPIPVTSFQTSNTVGSNIVPITSFQYQDVGILIEVEPRVHHNEEISLQIAVEVSNVRDFVQSQPIIGTRNIETTIRLKDGETNFLAGLLRTDESSSDKGVPGLSDIPVLGRLFSNRNRRNSRTDIVLTLTPHIIRRADITEDDLMPIWVGTESNISVRGGSPRVESEVEGPFDDQQPTPEEVQENMRQRLQQLPRGLRDPGEPIGEQQPPQPPLGTQLVPSSGPERPFGLPPRDDEKQEEEPEPPGSLSALAPPAVPLAPIPQVVLTSQAASAPGAGEEPLVRLRLSPAGVEVRVGDELALDLLVDALVPVAHLPLTLRYQAEDLEYLAIEAGDFLGAPGEFELLAAPAEAGRLVVGMSRLGDRPGVSGAGVAARVRFRARRPGRSEVSFEKAQPLSRQLEAVARVRTEPVRVLVRPGALEERERPPIAFWPGVLERARTPGEVALP